MALCYIVKPQQSVSSDKLPPYELLTTLFESLTDDVKLKYTSIYKLDKNLKQNNPIGLYIPYMIKLAQDLSNELMDQSVNSLLDYFAKNICGEHNWETLLQKHNISVSELKQTLSYYSEPLKPYDYPIELIAEHKLSNKIPHDVYNCCLDRKLFDDVLTFSQQTGYDDYRLLVALDSAIEKKVENVTG